METEVVAAVIERDGKYLLCQRPQGKRYGGLWEFPGGKVLPGESFLDAARRELREELGMVVDRVGEVCLSVPDPGSEFVIHFVDVAANGTPQNLEHADVAWVLADELLSLSLAPSDRTFAEYLAGPEGSE
jgi:mutator protein MutT